ncbi:MAG: hypothetical protein ACI8PZ_006607 [Myxococcota bacterium]|jgi:hypothetical protein
MRAWLALLCIGCTASSELPDHWEASAAGAPPWQGPASADVTLPAVTDADWSAPLFDDEVSTIGLEIGEPGLLSLLDAPDVWVPATLVVDGLRFEPVSVRLKGNGSFQPITSKPSWKIDLNRHVEGLDLRGLKRLVLNNMSTDPTHVREVLAYRMYREAGVPAARAGHAWVTVNGEPYGLYTAMEDVDADLLAQWFDDPTGPLYELNDVDFWPDSAPEFEHEDGPDDRTAIQGTIDALTLPPDDAVAAADVWMHIGQFRRFFAVSVLVGQFDAYPLTFPGDDAHLYVDPSDGRIRWLPHGLDETFRDIDQSFRYPYGLVGDACMRSAGCRDDFTADVWDVLAMSEGVDGVGLEALANTTIDRVAPYVRMDPRRLPPLARVAVDQALLLEFIRTRPDRIADDLGPRPDGEG